jgi:hypothetical protein
MFQVIKKNCRRLAVYYNFWLIDRTRAGVPARGFPPHPKALVTASRIIVAAGVSLRKYTHIQTRRRGMERGGPHKSKLHHQSPERLLS